MGTSAQRSNKDSELLPLIPLGSTAVLLPGVTIRIPLQGRNDIAALLANIYSKASTPQPDASAISVGCVPVNSPYLSRDGRKLLEGGSLQAPKPPIDPLQATATDLFAFGTLAKVTGVQGRSRGELSLVLEGVSRFEVQEIKQERPYFEAKVVIRDEEQVTELDLEVREAFDQLKQLSRELLALIRLSSLLPSRTSTNLSPLLARRLELYIVRKDLQEAGVLADFMTNVIDCTYEEKLRILAAITVKARLDTVVEILQRNIASIQSNNNVSISTITQDDSTTEAINKLRQQVMLRGLSNGVGSGIGSPSAGQNSEEPNEIEELRKRLDAAKLSSEAQKVADRELKRLQKMNPAQAEYGVCRTYLENLAEIPWTKVTDDRLDASTLTRARQQLDDDHYGLEKIKKRLLEYLAVLKLKQSISADMDAQIARLVKDQAADKDQGKETSSPTIDQMKLMSSKRSVDKSPILLLVGPPGTGKTSLAKSVATALGRKFHRISLGGVRDEAEIRGHRRTYVAAMPGLIVNGLKKVGVANPVVLLDEIDKVGTSSFHGDPSAAMLEVLDPEQNHTFTDHYVNIPIDLSKVLFIATANSLDTIPAPLLDRMETIELSGYTTLEKRHIAARHLLPKQVLANGMTPEDVSLSSEVLDKIITSYTREAGVRNLERELGAVCRAKAVQYSDSKDQTTAAGYLAAVEIEDLEEMLGVERFEEELAANDSRPGIVTGLVAYSTGAQGSILFIEVVDVVGSGGVKLTGKLGDVLKESVEVALTWVKAHAFDLALTAAPSEDLMRNRALHVHCPSGAIPKDGPSAGLAHTIAMVSLFAGKSVAPTLAMTGEMSLRGKVLPVGGIREKLIGALRAGCKKVLLPAGNRKDVRELPDEVRDGLEIVHVAYIWEALREVWPDARWGAEGAWSAVESRL